MTIASNLNKHTYQGNGVQTDWPYTFKIFTTDGSDIKLLLTNVATGAVAEITSNYSVDVNSQVVTYPVAGSPLTSANKITLLRVEPITQELDMVNQGAFLAQVIEDGLDKQTAISQQINEQLSRTLKHAVSADSDVSLELPAPVPLTSFRWDATGKKIEQALDPATVLNQLLNAVEDANIAKTEVKAAQVATEEAAKTAAAGAVAEVQATLEGLVAAIETAAAHTELLATSVEGTSSVVLETAVVGTTFVQGQKIDLEYIRRQQIYQYANLFKKLRNSQAVKICCQGDSLTYGQDGYSVDKRAKDPTPDDHGVVRLDTDTRASKTYPEALLEKLNLIYPLVTVTNRGWSGDSIKLTFDRWPSKSNADVTILNFGINDAADYSVIHGDLSLWGYWYEQVVIRLILQGSAVVIMLPTKNILNNVNIDVFSQSLRLFAEKYQIPIVDADEILRNYDKSIFSDTVHLNGYGYNILGSRLATLFLGAGMVSTHMANDGTKILTRQYRDDVHLIGNATFGEGGAVPTPSEIGTTLENGWCASLNAGGEIYFAFYAEVDDLLILPYLRTANANPTILEFQLDFGVDQPFHSISTAVDLTNYLAKRPASVLTFTNTKTNTNFNKNSHLLNNDNVEFKISTKGWHVLRIKNNSASSYVQIFGLEFMHFDVLRNLKVTQQPDIRCSFYNGEIYVYPEALTAKTESRIPFLALKTKLNWDPFSALGYADTPLKLTIHNAYKSILTYYFTLGTSSGDQKFVPASPTIRQNITASPTNERTLSAVAYDNTAKELVITWGGNTSQASKFTLGIL